MTAFDRKKGREPRCVSIRSDQGDKLRKEKKDINLSELVQGCLDVILDGDPQLEMELKRILNSINLVVEKDKDVRE